MELVTEEEEAAAAVSLARDVLGARREAFLKKFDLRMGKGLDELDAFHDAERECFQKCADAYTRYSEKGLSEKAFSDADLFPVDCDLAAELGKAESEWSLPRENGRAAVSKGEKEGAAENPGKADDSALRKRILELPDDDMWSGTKKVLLEVFGAEDLAKEALSSGEGGIGEDQCALPI